MKRLFCGLVVLGLSLGVPAQAKAQYIYTTLDPPGSTSTFADGINNSSQIVGNYTVGRGSPLGFLLGGGSYTTLDVPGSTGTGPFGINNAGQIVGVYGDARGAHGFLLSEGSYTSFDVAGSTLTVALGINDPGQIVGAYDAGGVRHGYLLSGGSYTTLDPPGSTYTEARGINTFGQIVGDYQGTDGRVHGYLATPVPEPFTLLLLGIGGAGLIRWAWRRRQVA